MTQQTQVRTPDAGGQLVPSRGTRTSDEPGGNDRVAASSAITGQGPTFGTVVRPHLGWMYSLARRLVGDADAAEDLVQKCLLKAFRGYDGLRDLDALPAWLKQILLNCCRDHLRRQGRAPHEQQLDDLDGYSLYRTLAVEDPLPYSDSLHLDFLSTFAIEDVWAVLDRLDVIHRVPLVLVHMEGYPTREVADMVGVPLNTLLSRLHRGRKRFEQELWGYAREHDLLGQAEGGSDDQL